MFVNNITAARVIFVLQQTSRSAELLLMIRCIVVPEACT